MAEEEALYQDANIRITNLRAMLQGKTYAMANVTSVSMFTEFAKRGPGIILAALGGFAVLVGFGAREEMSCVLPVGVLMLALGVIVALTAKNVYWVRIGSASGETNALSSKDYAYIDRIVRAMNDAIVRRG